MGSLGIQWALTFLAVAISIAAEYFNKHAKARGLPFVAIARGTSPAPMPEAVRTGLQAAGFDMSRFESKHVRRIDALIEELSKSSRSPS